MAWPFDDHSLDHVSMNVYWSGCATASELMYSLTTRATSLHYFWSLLLPFLGDMEHSPIFAAGYFWWILSIAMPSLTITAGADDLIYITSFVPKWITTWSGFSSLSLSSSAISSVAPDWFEMMTPSGDSMWFSRDAPMINILLEISLRTSVVATIVATTDVNIGAVASAVVVAVRSSYFYIISVFVAARARVTKSAFAVVFVVFIVLCTVSDNIAANKDRYWRRFCGSH